MRILSTCVIAGVSLLLPLTASAQSNDAKYCTALADAYTRYVGRSDTQHRGPAPNASIKVAMDRCDIPVLEKALTDAKVELPKRS
jgi:hypothetical protein